ncbi:MAG: type II toxin-antitoxin system PemK/MazF family toxin [Thermoleophilia bacterium]
MNVFPPDDAGRRNPASRPVLRRGDLCWFGLPEPGGAGNGGMRPVLIIQNDTGNDFGITTIVAPVAAGAGKRESPLIVAIPEGVLEKESEVRLNQLMTLEKDRIGERIASLTQETMVRVDEALQISLGLPRR